MPLRVRQRTKCMSLADCSRGPELPRSQWFVSGLAGLKEPRAGREKSTFAGKIRLQYLPELCKSASIILRAGLVRFLPAAREEAQMPGNARVFAGCHRRGKKIQTPARPD